MAHHYKIHRLQSDNKLREWLSTRIWTGKSIFQTFFFFFLFFFKAQAVIKSNRSILHSSFMKENFMRLSVVSGDQRPMWPSLSFWEEYDKRIVSQANNHTSVWICYCTCLQVIQQIHTCSRRQEKQNQSPTTWRTKNNFAIEKGRKGSHVQIWRLRMNALN